MFGTYQLVHDALLAFAGSLNSAFNIISKLLGNKTWLEEIKKSAELVPLIDAIKGVAITLCVLFFLIDFFSKTLHLQWVTWENVMMLFLKLVVAKVCVENADALISIIYNGFADLAVNMPSIEIIPKSNGVQMAQYFWLSESEAQKVFPTAVQDVGFLNFEPMWMLMKSEVMYFLMQILLVICNVIVIGRIFELAVYTIIAPIPLSTLACEGLQDVGKGFLKAYVAVCLQAVVIMVMFVAYSTLHLPLNELFENSGIAGWLGLIEIFTLALGIMQSGSWAKRICGAV